jgi:hypothetical protein
MMSQEEIYNSRDRTYSAWHRRCSTGRFVGIERAQNLAMIDLDAALYIEYDNNSKEPLALIETARDVGQAIKPATVTRNLARRCHPVLPAYVLLYMPSQERNPADPTWPDIIAFRLRRIWPEPESNWQKLSPGEWAKAIVMLRKWSSHQLDRILFPTASYE